MTRLSHDPFARTALVRAIVFDTKKGGCHECGDYTRVARAGYLFMYGTEHDDTGRINWHQGQFCSRGCHNSYHGV
jgi:hypothetical protein